MFEAVNTSIVEDSLVGKVKEDVCLFEAVTISMVEDSPIGEINLAHNPLSKTLL